MDTHMTRKTYTPFTSCMIKPLLSCLLVLLFAASAGFAQGTFIKSGTTMKISTGTTVFESGGMTLDAPTSGPSTLTNDGTLIVKGNFTNNNTSESSLGSGTISFEGTSAQTISGPNVFGTLKINNTAGVSFTGTYDSQVSTALNLTAGLLTLGSRNLLLLGSAAIVGTPDATKMVVASGTGELRKRWSGNGSFTFPVGDNTGSAEYSPVTLNFTSGTYPGSNYIGVSLVDAAYNPSIYTGSYLTRYWVVTNASGTPITSFNCDATFNYLEADVTGTETEIYTTKVAPDPVVTYAAANTSANTLSATGLNSFSTFTGTKGAMAVSLTAFLEGPYNTTNHNLNTTINGLIPSNQPYSGAPWNYSGTESFTPPVAATAVDWVLVELRQAVSPGTATTFFARQAGLLLSNGQIVDKGGSGPLKFFNVTVSSGNNLYPVIYHRNHMPVMANNAGTLNPDGSIQYNFTTGSGQIYGTGKIQVETGIWAMLAGDADNDMQIGNTDFDLWGTQFGGVSYLLGDFDLDHQVGNTDYDKWATNFAKVGSLP